MPCTREQEACARDRRAAEILNEIVAEFLGARDLVWGWMPAQNLSREEGDAIAELLDTVTHRFAAVAERSERAARTEGSTDAA